jgi:dihydroorotate dehydrogenase
LNGKWCLYYASLGFDVLTYKTVRSRERACYPLPNLQPVHTEQLMGGESELPAAEDFTGSWAVSYGMPSRAPRVWQQDVEATRRKLPSGKLLSVSVVASVQPGWTLDDLAADYAQCARWAVDSGADAVETNFSCPNVSTCDGQLFQQPADARIVAQRVREAIGSIPYIAKIGHVASREAGRQLLDALSDCVDALAMTNSVATRVRQGQALLFDGQQRGICGHAILDASVLQMEMFAALVREAGLSMRLIGVGGISTSEHVLRYLAAGANACHVATAAMANPGVALSIRKDLAHAWSAAVR